MVELHAKDRVTFHVPRGNVLGPDPEPLGTERFDRIMAGLQKAGDTRLDSLPQLGAQQEQRPALAA